MSNTTPDAPIMDFEDALARLEKIVRRLESGEAKLDESLQLFEEGVGLARICSAQLDKAEGKMQVLVERAGRLETEPFEGRPAAGGETAEAAS